MSMRRMTLAALVALSAGAVVSGTGWAKSSIGTNADGSVSRGEAHAAAEKKFERLDARHTGKLTYKELPPAEKAIREMAHHDKDHAIDRTEYMSGVDAAFKEADPKSTGVLNAAALKTKAGKHFLSLVE